MRTMAELNCPLPIRSKNTILLGHGSGGRLSSELLQDVFLRELGNPILSKLEDQAIVPIGSQRVAISTDSFVVKPLFFPGGDIGSLAVNGTVNDLAMCGATPLYLSAAFILEEGLSRETLCRVVHSMREAAEVARVQVVTGDTKVVERGKGDQLFINTTGLGVVAQGLDLSAAHARCGDKVILSGSIGDHGIAIMAQREGFEFESAISSDCAALHGLVTEMLRVSRGIRCMRDPTRGGLSSTLHEIAVQSGVAIEIEEREIPVHEDVKGACELLGLDPLYVANEGKLVAIAAPEEADEILSAMRRHPLGREACITGRVSDDRVGLVTMRTRLGTSRIVDILAGDQLPRIC